MGPVNKPRTVVDLALTTSLLKPREENIKINIFMFFPHFKFCKNNECHYIFHYLYGVSQHTDMFFALRIRKHLKGILECG